MTIFKGFKKKGVAKPQEIKTSKPDIDARTRADKKAEAVASQVKGRKETGGPKGLEPTRYGDWEKSGRCIDF